MLDIILEKLKKFFTSRLLPIVIVYVALFAVLVSRIFTLQIIEGDTHAEREESKLSTKREIKSTRGNIYDRNGVLLAYNKLSYSVVIEDSTGITSNSEKNAMIYRLIQIVEENGDAIDLDFPIQVEDGTLEFNVKGTALKKFKQNAYAYVLEDKKLTKEQEQSTAQEVFDFLCNGKKGTPMFGNMEAYSLEDALKIMSIRYAIFINYPKYLKITVATNVSDPTVAAIKENREELPGVDIAQESYRVYNDSKYFAHMLGYTGRISALELEQMQTEDDYYNNTDVIGKSGLEKKFEEYLGGVKGNEEVTVNSVGKVLSIESVTNPVAGNDLYLTVDSKLQKAAYHILENKIAGILVQKINNGMDYGSKGTSAVNIRIPIYEVYYALLDNNIIDIKHFTKKDATSLEKSVHRSYERELETVFKRLKNLLSIHSTVTNEKAGKDMQSYLEYIYASLKSNKVLLASKIDTKSEAYVSYVKGTSSLSEFLQYAIANNWIELEKLKIGSEYLSTEEIYNKLLDYIIDMLKHDSNFGKMIYRNMIFSYKLSGREICLLLFDQGVLEYKEADVAKLKSGAISPYSFMINKIRNLEITPGQLALEPCSGSLVVTDPNNGEVLALVSYPSYDNNKLANKVDPDYWANLAVDKANALLNRPTQQATAPGSTFKMVTAITGLQENVVTLHERILDQTKFTKIIPSPRCWSRYSHGKEDVVDAIRDSCNYFFYETGWRLGGGNTGNYNDKVTLNKIQKYAKMFGLDKTSGIELIESEPRISDDSGIRSTIGQGTNNFTPTQLSKYVSTLANGGTCYDLTLVKKVVNKDEKTVYQQKPNASTELKQVSKANWNAVMDGMYEVVNKGSISKLFKDMEVTVAGKTGTAEQTKLMPNHALFVSFAPLEHAEISVTTVIPNGYTSANAAEVARNVYRYYYKDIKLKDIMKSGATISSSGSTVTD